MLSLLRNELARYRIGVPGNCLGFVSFLTQSLPPQGFAVLYGKLCYT